MLHDSLSRDLGNTLEKEFEMTDLFKQCIKEMLVTCTCCCSQDGLSISVTVGTTGTTVPRGTLAHV